MTGPRICLLLALSALSMASISLPVRVAGLGGRATLTAESFTNPRTWRLPDEGPISGNSRDHMLVGVRNADGVTHLYFAQRTDDPKSVGPGAFLEVAAMGTGSDPASWATATKLTCIQNWGLTAAGCRGGAAYDMWNGKLGGSYDTGTLVINRGLPITGGAWHNGYFYESYGSPYGNYVATWSTVASVCPAPGQCTTYGPWRFCHGVWPYGGPQDCGPRRSGHFFECPFGMCDTSSSGNANQDIGSQYGDSIFALDKWPDSSTPSGYGTTRNRNEAYRSTDLVSTHDLLAHYNLTSAVSSTTGRITTKQDMREALIRQPINGRPPYLFEGYADSTSGHSTESYVDPLAYGGRGTFVIGGDYQSGMSYATTAGGLAGYVEDWVLSTRSRYYQTDAGTRDSVHGTVFDRTPYEATLNMHQKARQTNGSNAEGAFFAKATGQHYTMRFITAGRNHGTTDCSYSAPNFTVTLKTDGSGKVVSTMSDVATAVNGTSECSSLIKATADHEGSGDGTGIVNAFPATLLARGPAVSPVHGNDCHVVVTGPCSDLREVFISIYDPADLGQKPDYLPQPAWVSINGSYGLNAGLKFIPNDFSSLDSNRKAFDLCGSVFDPVNHTWWLCAGGADANTGRSLVHQFTLVGSPTPTPIPSWPVAVVLAGLVQLTRQRRSLSPADFAHESD